MLLFQRLYRGILAIAISTISTFSLSAVEKLSLDVISYQSFITDEPGAFAILERALHEKGIVGIRGVPGYREKVDRYIDAVRKFSALPEHVKQSYTPNREAGEFLGYEKGREQFKRPDGSWVPDDLKVSFYALVPNYPENRWPVEVDLREPFQELGALMSNVGTAVMEKIGLIGPATGIYLDEVPRTGRMLYYRKSSDSMQDTPYWCGAHYDHGMFTALIPAFYYMNGKAVKEPEEAGLYVKTTSDGQFKKVVSDDPDVLLFQVGEFGQLATDDAIRATEHRVQKASGTIERYTMALFFSAPDDAVIRSYSELTRDARYGGMKGDPCSFRAWHEASLNRYLVR